MACRGRSLWQVTQGRPSVGAAVLATVLQHSHGTSTYDLSLSELNAAIEALTPATACTEIPHPNLAAWREIKAEAESNPARSMVAVFVDDFSDPVDSNADATLRAQLQGHRPVTRTFWLARCRYARSRRASLPT